MKRACLAAWLACAALPAAAECEFNDDGEITNPFEPGCGDVLFTYTEDDNTGTDIALGYAPPLPVASLTPVDLASHGHSGFILPDAEGARMREDVARQYLLGYYRQSGPPAAIAAEIRALPGDEVVYRAQWTRSGAGARVLAVEVNEALVPGGTYRLWVAFNKPMRIRDSSGSVVPYAGQNPGATAGPVTLEIPALDDEIALGGGAWLDAPGGAPDGYLRYADDAFAVDFTLPDSIEADAAMPAVLVLDPLDLAEMALDADLATAADWDGGHWVSYEDTDGTDGDTGGARLLVQAVRGAGARDCGACQRGGLQSNRAATTTTPAATPGPRRRRRWIRPPVDAARRASHTVDAAVCGTTGSRPPFRTR